MLAHCIARSSFVRICSDGAKLVAFLLFGVAGGTEFCQAQSRLELITTNTGWRFNQSGMDMGTNWVLKDYDDTIPGWEGPGRMLFGFETTPLQYLPFSFLTPFPDPQSPITNFRTNYYFRTHFTVPSLPPAALASILLI